MKTLIEVDDELLDAAREELGTTTKKDTVNEALRYVADRRSRAQAMLHDPYFLGGSDLGDDDVMSGARR